jgi:TPP-dependent pyruvate/acetoin dehydrogenase alpha subunit
VDVGLRRSVEDLRAWKARDPIARLERALVAKNAAMAAQVAAIHSTVRARIEEDSRRALDAPFPPAQALLDFVYARRGEQE